MPVVNTQGVQDLLFSAKNFFSQGNISSPSKGTNEKFPIIISELGRGVVTDQTPIELFPKESVISRKQISFFDDFYNRVVIIPSQINVGNLLNNQTRIVEVWNSFFTTVTLNSIVGVNAEGMTISPSNTPRTFLPLNSTLYSLGISIDGPATINGNFNFIFDVTNVKLIVTGRRSVVWPFVPEKNVIEGLEFRTTIINSFNSSQRLALRKFPRQTFSFDHILNENEFSLAKTISAGWAQRVFGVPAWNDATRITTTLLQGETSINFDTTNADYRPNDVVLLWLSPSNFASVEITTIQSNRLNLKVPLDRNWIRPLIMPLRFGRALDGFGFSRSSNAFISSQVNFEVNSNLELTDPGFYPIYRNKQVLTDRPIIVGSIEEKIFYDLDVFDNGSGPISVDIKNSLINNIRTVSFIENSKADIWQLKRWLHSLKGRQRSFWFPTWNKDLILTNDVNSGSVTIKIQAINYTLFSGVKDIMIRLTNGTLLFRRILSSAFDVDGNEILTLSTSFTESIARSSVDLICFLDCVCLNSDKIEIKYLTESCATCEIKVIGVRE